MQVAQEQRVAGLRGAAVEQIRDEAGALRGAMHELGTLADQGGGTGLGLGKWNGDGEAV